MHSHGLPVAYIAEELGLSESEVWALIRSAYPVPDKIGAFLQRWYSGVSALFSLFSSIDKTVERMVSERYCDKQLGDSSTKAFCSGSMVFLFEVFQKIQNTLSRMIEALQFAPLPRGAGTQVPALLEGYYRGLAEGIPEYLLAKRFGFDDVRSMRKAIKQSLGVLQLKFDDFYAQLMNFLNNTTIKLKIVTEKFRHVIDSNVSLQKDEIRVHTGIYSLYDRLASLLV